MSPLGRLTRLQTTDENHPLRTSSVEGECQPPEIGNMFVLINDEPLTKGASNRWVNTSPVKEIVSETETEIVFRTESGTLYVYEPINA